MRHGRIEDGFMGPAVHTEGDEHVNAAWEAETKAKRQSLARKALKADADNIDAYVILGLEAATLAESIALFHEAVRVGERLWADWLDEPEMHWWGFVGTRPWMRAMHNLALALEEAGDTEEAEAHYRRLLQLNPGDNQGIRALLIRCLMDKPRIGELRALLKEYAEDDMIEAVMARLWLALRGKRADMARLGPPVEERNEHVLPMLAGRFPENVDRSPFGIMLGGPDEAAEYADQFGAIWARSPKALAMIRSYVDRA